MLRDVFYYGAKPNVHPREQYAESLDDARQKCTTEHFWIINEFCDYTGFDWDFDFEFLPDEDVWAENHCNVWPSQHQKDSGTWLCSSEQYDLNLIIYRNDVNPIKRKNIKNDCWVEVDRIDHSKFDFSWHPDPTSIPYIYKWGSKFAPVQLKSCLEYHVEGATDVKYMTDTVELLPDTDRWIEHQAIDKNKFDMSWRPDPMDPPLNYVWGNKYIEGILKPTLEYRVPGAVDTKYMPDLIPVLPEWDRWVEVQEVDKTKFDFSWRPDPREPAYIYTWGNKYIDAVFKPTLEYHCEGATEVKYMNNDVVVLPDYDRWIISTNMDLNSFDFAWRPDPREPDLIYEFATQWQSNGGPRYVMLDATEVKYTDEQKVKRLPDRTRWTIPDNIDTTDFDFSWHPDATSPPYIYVFATQWAFSGGPVYTVPNATEIKYVDDQVAKAKEDRTNWHYDSDLIDIESFDFSWHPYIEDQPYIYTFGTQWQKTGGPTYVTPGSDVDMPTKYIDTRIIKSKRLPCTDNWHVLDNLVIKDFDYSWHPDETEEPYIYVFGNTQYPAEIMPTIEYRVEGATRYKYVNDIVATLDIDMSNWKIYVPIDESSFDFTWKPDPKAPPYIYVWGNKYVDGKYEPTVEYIVDNATEKQYMNELVEVTPQWDRWTFFTTVDKESFDFSWRPDPLEPPYIYTWGNKYEPAVIKPTMQYACDGATDIRYMDDLVDVLPEWDRWQIPENVDHSKFDFTWRPDPLEPAFIYEFATQWQKTGGPRYIAENATKVTYVDFQKVKRLSDNTNWTIPDNVDIVGFDFSWHPDDTSPPYIYVFATQWAFSGGPVYTVSEATEVKYVDTQVAKATADKTNWEYDPSLIDEDSFDFSWHPYIEDQPYIYEFGTQWQKTGGPTYITPGCDSSMPIKYIDTRIIKSKRLPCMDNWHVLDNLVIKDFDYSWHPDTTEEPYIYVFGNTQYPAEIMPTIEYRVAGATQYKYVNDIVATLDVDMSNWEIDTLIDKSGFDFTWKPDPKAPPYIYEFGTQWQKTGGPRYVIEGATEVKYVDTMRVKILPDSDRFNVLDGNVIKDFDFSWHPDSTEEPYIYVFGNTQYPAEIMPTIEYRVKNATTIKYVNDIVATLDVNMNNWVIPDNIDDSMVDYTWRPNPTDPAFIYEFGTQWQKTGGPRYVVEGATETKYVDGKNVIRLASIINWHVLDNLVIKDFDYSWHPDETEEPYIYVFGNTQYPAEVMHTIEYRVENATVIKYVSDIVATLGIDMSNWIIPDNIDDSTFDYSWKPNPKEEPYLYEFVTQWQKTGGPRYVVPNATERKFIDDQRVSRLPSDRNWTIPDNLDITGFDFSWHPDDTDPPYIYVFATQWAFSGGPIYTVDGATETKYVDDQIAIAQPDKTNWEYDSDIIDIESFDFSWHPYIEDQPYIYKFGTQWQKTGGPTYITPGCDDNAPIKYIDPRIIKAKRLPNNQHLFTPVNNLKIKDFDYSWHPDETEEPYIYVFGNTQYPAEIMPTVEYRMPNATVIKYVSNPVATLANNMENWNICVPIDEDQFDFSWVPNPKAPPYIYVWGNKYVDGKYESTVEYRVPGATDIQYMLDLVEVTPQWDKWVFLKEVDKTSFNFSWRPDPLEPPYIYTWGNKYEPAEITPTMQYHCAGATDIRYMSELVAVLPEWDKWQIPSNIDKTSFDFSWRPDPREPAFIYEFGTQWQKTGGPRYVVDTATDVKYMDILTATRLPEQSVNWKIPKNVDVTNFDYSWHPDDLAPPYIYQFGTQWQKTGGPQYIVDGATQIRYESGTSAIMLSSKANWEYDLALFDESNFDFSWHPDDAEEAPYIYQFGTQWWETGGPKYITPKATSNSQVKYIDQSINKATLRPSLKNWEIANIDVSTFDFAWVPHPEAPPYIYQFGTLEDANDGPRYVSPDTNGEVIKLKRIIKADEEETISIVRKYYIETTLDDLVKQHPDELFWAMHKNIDYSSFDFEWRPALVEIAYELDYVHTFGSPESELTQTYFVSGKNYLAGNTSFKFIESETKLDDKTLFKIFKKSDMFYVDRGNSESQARFDVLKALYPQIQKTRYLNSWVDTIKRCTNRATSELIWVLNSELDYNHFDFEYYPNPWQMNMVHVFGTQWSHWGTTFMVNRETFAEDTKYINIIEHLSNLNFVKNIRANATQCVHDTIIIDHGNKELDTVVQQVTDKTSGKNVTVVKYNNSYLQTLKDVVARLPEKKEHYLWLCSSVCDYSSFDFSYTVDPFARDNLHVFASGKQKFGDTFFIDVNKTKEIIDDMLLLEDYHKVNYNGTLKVNRLPEPVIVTSNDTLIDAAISIEGFPYATIISADNKNISVVDSEPMNLWAPETKNIMITSTGATRITVPREVKDHVKKELYDYPYIKRLPKLAISSPMDIVYLSNGETGAEENWEHLQKITKGLKNRVMRVDGVNGRVQAYHAALEASETPWAFTVFAKLKISPKFDFNWQPDRMQVAKHYVFHAKNPVNGLIYGHQAMIAYNKALTLANSGHGLDFTQDDEHEVVPLLSGTANYNTDEFSTWRTAFREVLKLKAEDSDIARQRLDVWLNKATGDYFQYSIKGAIDADEYYDEVDGDFEMLKLSYEWAWLKERFANS